jgi:hypothetical protein
MPKSLYALLLMLSLPVLAQAPPGAAASPAAQAFKYDPATEVLLTGQVREVRSDVRGRRLHPHPPVVRLVLDAGGARMLLVVGPAAFLAKQQVAFAPGDMINFLASRRSFRGREFFLAREITRAGQTLVLRDPTGIPAWRKGPDGNRPDAADLDLPEAF